MNIGVILGSASGGLIDVDLDWPEAARLASRFLPATGMIFGRHSKPQSHWIYRVTDGDLRRETFVFGSGDSATIVEIRGSGHQTVFPGSLHPCGESVEFQSDGEPAVVPLQKLLTAVRLVAGASLLVKHWPTGARHDAALSLAGGLLNAGWPDNQVRAFISVISEAAGDEQVDDRARCVTSTREQLSAGKPTVGWPRLEELLGKPVVTRVLKFLNVRPSRPRQSVNRSQGPYEQDSAGTWWFRPTTHGPARTLLANFSARIVADVEKDDGTSMTRMFEIEAWIGDRSPRRRVVTPAEFDSLRWVPEILGAQAIVQPGHATDAHLRTAIKALSTSPAERRIFTHTGWTRAHGRDVYLHAGGAISADDHLSDRQVEIELPPALSLFRLPAPPVRDAMLLACSASLNLLHVAPTGITIPLLAAVGRAALSTADFSLFLVGPTGAKKSELAALVQRFFGPAMDARHLPASWASTANANESLAFHAKDSLLTIDDFKPNGDRSSDSRLHAAADRLFRGQGNGLGRGRMNTDTSLRAALYPRGLILATGEDLPQGESLAARLVVLDVHPDGVDLGRLTKCQADAHNGLYAAFMAAFLRWVARDRDTILTQMRTRSDELRVRWRPGHARHADSFAQLHSAFEILLNFIAAATNEQALTRDELKRKVNHSLDEFDGLSAKLRQGQSDEDPAVIFMSALRSAIASRRAHLTDRNGGPPVNPRAWGWTLDGLNHSTAQPCGLCIGWQDGDNVYMDGTTATEVIRSLGVRLTVCESTMRKRLDQRGFLRSRDETRKTLTVRRVHMGVRRDVLHFTAHELLGAPPSPQPETAGNEPPQQQRLNLKSSCALEDPQACSERSRAV